MSERILRALMQLFAIIAKINDDQNPNYENNSDNEQIIRSFLKIELISSKIDYYIDVFNENYDQLGGKKSNPKGDYGKRTSVNSVKVLRICHEINKELTIRQKFIVLMRIMELILQDDEYTELEFAFIRTVAESFRIPESEYMLIFSLLNNDISIENPEENCFILTGEKTTHVNKFYVKNLDRPIVCVRINKNELIFFKYTGSDDIYLNGELIDNRKAFLLSSGASIKTSKSSRIYQVNLVNHYYKEVNTNKFIFEAKNIHYRFKTGNSGIRDFSCCVESGNLVGIMGGSGTGKSTLIDLLTGAKKPQKGTVTINGIDVHNDRKLIDGQIGFVPQQDLLIEELTVYQNLYYTAKLSIKDASESEIKRKVLKLLTELSLSEVKHLKVGSPLKKIISGGQRKRLNIALELIRNPAVLFVDEPTSGLSSIGSLKIMNILKELSFKGTLVFVVIHQPSSDVFKLLNELIILDNGGYQIYEGVPSYATNYFKRILEFANADNESCSYCGNINPEQIFETIEAKVINEYGLPTYERKISPKKWHEIYKKEIQSKLVKEIEPNQELSLPKPLKKPGKLKQLSVYFQRDFATKTSSFNYGFFILTEAPILAFIMSFFLKYYIEIDGQKEYIYYYNENIPVFIFVSILVSIFLGMTVAAEEINKDKRNLKREQFLQLSWSSYLFAKVTLLGIVSAIQSLLYVLVGIYVLEISNFIFEFWVIMLSVSICCNMIGLNISSAFRQTKLIYIIIPILIIPLIIFSGLIISYDRMNPAFSHPQKVPLVGNLMVSRWGYEALAVELASSNEFATLTYDMRKKSSEYQWKKDYWIPQIHELAEEGDQQNILQKEIEKESKNWNNLTCNNCFEGEKINIENINKFLSVLHVQYTNNYNLANDSIEVIKQEVGLKKYGAMREKYANESLENLVTNRTKLDKIIVDYKDEVFYQIKDPIYQTHASTNSWDAPLFIKEKNIGRFKIDTYYFNLIMIWGFTLILFVVLHFEVLRKLIQYLKLFQNRFQKKTIRLRN